MIYKSFSFFLVFKFNLLGLKVISLWLKRFKYKVPSSKISSSSSSNIPKLKIELDSLILIKPLLLQLFLKEKNNPIFITFFLYIQFFLMAIFYIIFLKKFFSEFIQIFFKIFIIQYILYSIFFPNKS